MAVDHLTSAELFCSMILDYIEEEDSSLVKICRGHEKTYVANERFPSQITLVKNQLISSGLRDQAQIVLNKLSELKCD